MTDVVIDPADAVAALAALPVEIRGTRAATYQWSVARAQRWDRSGFPELAANARRTAAEALVPPGPAKALNVPCALCGQVVRVIAPPRPADLPRAVLCAPCERESAEFAASLLP